MYLLFVTHPEVVVDPEIPVPEWGLSAEGRSRMKVFAESAVAARVTSVWSSDEMKAVEAADILAARVGCNVQRHKDMGENDRSATGFLPPSEFEQVADAFFAKPNESVRGWERAIDAQRRIRQAVETIAASHPRGDLAIISHGAVGTLLRCAWQGLPISRSEDQPFQGHYWKAELPALTIAHGWKPIAPRRAVSANAASQ